MTLPFHINGGKGLTKSWETWESTWEVPRESCGSGGNRYVGCEVGCQNCWNHPCRIKGSISSFCAKSKFQHFTFSRRNNCVCHHWCRNQRKLRLLLEWVQLVQRIQLVNRWLANGWSNRFVLSFADGCKRPRKSAETGAGSVDNRNNVGLVDGFYSDNWFRRGYKLGEVSVGVEESQKCELLELFGG